MAEAAKITVTVDVTEPGTAAKASLGPDWNADGRADVEGLVVKQQEELRTTLVVAYPANKADAAVAADGHRDFASKEAVRDAAWNYLKKSRNIGLRHEDGTDGAGEVVESFLWPAEDWTVKAADGSEHVVQEGDWMLKIRWSPEAWEMVKSGEIGGVSMQGRAARRKPSAAAVASLRS